MRKGFNVVPLMLIAAVFCQAAEQKKEQIVTFKMTQKIMAKTSQVVSGAWMAVGKDGRRRPYPYKSEKDIPGVESKFWIKEDKLRSETKTLSGNMITIIAGDWLYSIEGNSKVAKRQPVVDKEISIVEKDPTRLLALFKKRGGLKQTGTEKMGEDECNVYQFNTFPPRERSTVTIWARKRDGVVVKQRKETSLAVTITEYRNIKIGAAIPDSMFEVPKGYELKDNYVGKPK